jgi:hypothetical protein
VPAWSWGLAPKCAESSLPGSCVSFNGQFARGSQILNPKWCVSLLLNCNGSGVFDRAHGHPLGAPVHLYWLCIAWQSLSSAIEVFVQGSALGNTDLDHHETSCQSMVRIELLILTVRTCNCHCRSWPGPQYCCVDPPLGSPLSLASRTQSYGEEHKSLYDSQEEHSCP